MRNTFRLLTFFCVMFLFNQCEKEKIVNELESIAFYKSKIVLNTFNTASRLEFKNMGEKDVLWKIKKYDDFLLCSRDSGYIQPAGFDSVQIFIDEENFILSDTIKTRITFIMNDKELDIPIEIYNLSTNKLVLTYNIIDAEYDNIHDKIICISNTPINCLRIVNPEFNTCDSILLNYTPNCISITKDGKNAIIGHNAHLTYVNLENKSIVKVIDISCYVSDIVIGNNNWAYAFSKDQYGAYNINISEGKWFINNDDYNIYFGTKAKLHSSGKYIYTADNGLSPSDVQKFSIINDTLVELYNSRYHGDYPIEGDLWFSESGDRLFARSGYVFKTSDSQDEDIYYNGRLEQSSYILSLCHSSQVNRIYAISRTSEWWWMDDMETRLDVYDGIYLNHLGTISIEKFKKPIDGNGFKFFDSLGKFVFINSGGNYIYVISKVISGSGLIYEWSMEKIRIE